MVVDLATRHHKEQISVTQGVALRQELDSQLVLNRISILLFDENGQHLTIPVQLGKATAGRGPICR
jgi:hypothetical protein